MLPSLKPLVWALLHFVWQGMLVGVALWIVLFAMRRRSAASRYAVSCAALGLMAILPAITAYWLYQRPSPPGAVDPSISVGAAGQFLAVATAGTATGWLALVQAWAVPVWCSGVLLFSIRLVWASQQVSKLRRRGEPGDATLLATVSRLADCLGLRRGVQVLISSIADGPSVVGVLRPVILLPAATLLGLTPQQLEAVLAHELAHILRYDYLVNIVQMLIEALLFYHPAVWWTSARIRRERELCCDDAAVAVCGDSLGYARALASLERLRATAPSLALASTDGPLAFRIKRLIGAAAASEERLPSKVPGVLALCLALACLGFSINRVHGQASQQPSPQEPRLAVAVLSPDAPGVRVDLGSSPVLHRTPVEYPAAARNQGIGGTVTAEVRLEASGNVSDARILSGPDELRKSVLESVLGWHFAPETGGSSQTISVTFQLPVARAATGKQPPAGDQAELTQRILQEERRALERDFQRNACDTPECSTQGALQALDRVLASLDEKLRAAQAAGDPQAQDAIQRALDQAKRESLHLAATPFGNRQQSVDTTADFLKAQQAELQARLAQLNTLEAQLQRLQATQAAGSREELDRQIVQTNAQLTELQTQLDRAAVAQRSLQTAPLEGRTLRSIQVLGVGIPPEDFLAKANLPVRVGDTLPQGSVEATIAAVKKFDEHLAVLWLRVEPMAVMLQIVAPGAGGVPGGRGGRGGGPGPGAAAAPAPARREPGVTPPEVVQRVEPEYTDEARKARWQGTVQMSVLVGKNGVPNDLRITNELGMGLDQSAIQAVWQWRFQPAMKDGRPVEHLLPIDLDFRLPAN